MTNLQFFISAALSMSIPVVLTTIGGVFPERAKNTNIAMEGMMLISCFFSLFGTDYFKNPVIGLFIGVFASIISALFLSFFIYKLHCNFIIAGIGLNLLASGLTWLLLEIIFNEPGAYAPRGINTLPVIRWEALKSIPIIGEPIYGQSIVLIITVLLVVIAYFLLNHTQFGYWVKAVGENEEAAEAVGIKVTRIRVITFIISAFCSGIAGSFLATSSINVFAINMTAGRGFIALGATIFGGGTVLGSTFAALLFGMAEAASVRFQTINVPVQFVLMIPYLATIIALFVYALQNKLRGKSEEMYESYSPIVATKE